MNWLYDYFPLAQQVTYESGTGKSYFSVSDII